jgi:hypothetical protein
MFIGLIKGIGFGVKIASSSANSRVFKGVESGAFGVRLQVLADGIATALYKKKLVYNTIPSTGAKHLSASRDISDWSVQLYNICTI